MHLPPITMASKTAVENSDIYKIAHATYYGEVLTHEMTQAFQDSVNVICNSGYHPIGGVSVVHKKIKNFSTSRYIVILTQSLAKNGCS